jgi:hypothetical protein
MPRVTQGLEAVVRTHRISSPTDARMLAAGAWNACNVCHLDRSIAWTLSELERGWRKKIEAEPAWASAYGGLDRPVGQAWLAGKDPSMRLVAAQAYAASPLGRDALPLLTRALDDPIAVNRVFGTFAVERVRGRALAPEEFDVLDGPENRRRKIATLLGE